MPQVPIIGGAYNSRAIIASAQRCVNLFPEINEDKQAPAPVTHFPTPGLVRDGDPPVAGNGRCIYTSTRGQLFEVIAGRVYFIDATGTYQHLGDIPPGTTPVIMSDNGRALILVNGTVLGWAIDIETLEFAQINDPNFLGGNWVTYLDTFFVLNVPGFVNQWYISQSQVTYANLTQGVVSPPTLWQAFDPLDYAVKTGSTDPVMGVVASHRSLWIVGATNSEVWYNSGSADFAFSIIPGVYVEHGTVAIYSIASQDNSIWWLSRDRYGQGVVYEAESDFTVKQVSPRGLEAIFSTFPTLSDAIGGVYNILGHFYYVLSFPTANRTFQYEKKTGEWNELAYTGPNGLERYRGQGWTQAYFKTLCYDRQNGRIYKLDPKVFTDDGAPITRVRTISHLVNEGKRMTINRVIADLQGGTLEGNQEPKVFLRISYDRGGTFSDPLEAMFGDTGDYAGMPFWTNLGLARDFVLELSWSAPIDTALNGMWIEATPGTW